MTKAFFVDFYGTLVYEDGEVVKKITEMIFNTGMAESVSEIGAFWWKDFQKMCTESHADSFKTQRFLEEESIRHTLERFSSSADSEEMREWMFSYWIRPDIFEETKLFFEKSTIPIYVVSNIDTNDVMKAIEYHGLRPAGIYTSEDAKSYKPRKEIFELALKQAGLKNDEVIHIGDSLSSDVRGASDIGIRALWLNRLKKDIPEGVESITNLLEALDRIAV